MIVLDTNVVSEIMKPDPHPAVRAWLNYQVAETFYLSSVSIAESLFGFGALPPGNRRNKLSQAFDSVVGLFKGRILPFDFAAAQHYSLPALTAKAAGRGFPVPDGYIAAIASARGFVVASRDTSPYNSASVIVANPWDFA